MTPDPVQLAAALRALPKAHLHVHLECAMRRGTLHELAAAAGRPFLDPRFRDLPEFVLAYETVRDCVRSLDDLARVATEVAADAVTDGFVWTEIHFSPFAYGGRLGPPEQLVEVVLDALARVATPLGPAAGLVLGHNRARPPAEAADLVALASRYRGQGVVAIGLVGDERRYPAAAFADAFAGADGLLKVPHAGETAGPESVWAALDRLRADRIGHGVRAVEDPRLLDALAQRKICLDVCPTSNIALGVAESWQQHPLPELLRAGVPVSLGSDDPTLFGASALDEYLRAVTDAGLGAADIAAVARSSLAHSGAPESVRAAGLAGVITWLAHAPTALAESARDENQSLTFGLQI